jgi:acyl-CoA dehydrogenase family protein 9
VFVASSPSSTAGAALERAEQLLVPAVNAAGLAQGLFAGEFRHDQAIPWPLPNSAQQSQTDRDRASLKEWLTETVDAHAIDTTAELPADLMTGLAIRGLPGGAVESFQGGTGRTWRSLVALLQEVAGHSSAAATVLGHTMATLQGLARHASESQKAAWMPSVARGEKHLASAFWEAESGGDSAGVTTRARNASDGQGFVLKGEKDHVVLGGQAEGLLLLARTPAASQSAGQLTALLLSSGQPGVRVAEARQPSSGVRGVPFARLDFEDAPVARTSVVGPIGTGMRVAQDVEAFGRLLSGATASGLAGGILEWIVQRVQHGELFGQPLASQGMARSLLASAAALHFAMETTTEYVAHLFDEGSTLPAFEAALLKLFSSEAARQVVSDAIGLSQSGGNFQGCRLERASRDVRFLLRDWGANEPLQGALGAAGLKELAGSSSGSRPAPWRLALPRNRAMPAIPVANPRLQPAVSVLSRQIQQFGAAAQGALSGSGDRQLTTARLGAVAAELFAASCVYARLFHLVSHHGSHADQTARQLQAGLLYLNQSARRNDTRLAALKENDDDEIRRTAEAWVGAGHAGH